MTLKECQIHWSSLIERVWANLDKKQLQARGVTVKLKLKNFHVLQHSKSFKHPLKSMQELEQILQLLLSEMYVPENDQFRLIGIGVYQLTDTIEQAQLDLW